MQYDFLILGSGLAGLYSANLASKYGKVALITKTTLQISNSYRAQGGVAAVMDPEDNLVSHINDTLTAGRGLCNKSAVEVLVTEGRDRILELIDMKVPFDMENDEIALGLEGGHSWRRILHSGGDSTGKQVVEFFIDLVKKNDGIDIYENTFVFDLITENNRCYGARTYNILTHQNINFTSPSTFIALGGVGGVFKRTTNPNSTTGDGIALAYLNGANIRDLEFMQFHPSALNIDGNEASLISEAVRGEGAYLLNHKNERFMLDKHELAELAPRDIVAVSIFNEIKKSDKDFIYLSLCHLDEEKIKSRFSGITEMLKKHNLNLAKDLIPISPAAHYTIGGIKTNLQAQTCIDGLYAFGEAASTGSHGANRLASNSLLECLVYGRRAVDFAKKNISSDFKNVPVNDVKMTTNVDLEKIFCDTKYKLAENMTNNVGIIRNAESLDLARKNIENISTSFPFEENEYFSRKIQFIITTQKIIIEAASKREETRGGHRRDDFTEINENLKGNFVFNINHEPVLKELKTLEI